MAGKPAKPKHVPQRTCVGCRAVLAKRTLIRIVRQPDGVFIDPTGKMNGRGAYLHDLKSCWERGLKGGLANGLKMTLTLEDRQRLESFMTSLLKEPVEPQANAGSTDAQA
jgi:predicted RNA-binding protein YlxR (DUF448 family)